MTKAKPLTTQDNKKLYFIIFILFFFSGMSGLIYQIVWTRMLVLIFGNTMLATSTVLSAYMAGLAAGSFVFGKYADKRPKGLLRVYALLEGGIGIFALIFPLLLSIVGPVYTSLYRGLASNLIAINFIRFLICFLLIAVPTFLMGATLPVLIKRFVRGTQTIGRYMGFLYGLNTAGAVAGSMICGFLFLRVMGMRGATLVAVGINLSVALLAWLVGKNETAAQDEKTINNYDKVTDKKELIDPDSTPTIKKWVLLGIGISGFCALAYEVFWTRMLNLFFHNTVYSFTTILATFLTGIALGSLIYSKFLSGVRSRIKLFIWVEIGIGIFAYATPFIFTLLYNPIFSKSAETFTILQAAVIMIGPTVLMGIALPLAVQICQRGPAHEGDSVGTVYAVNTIGSIIGAFAAGFLLMPNLGIQKSVAVVVSFNLLAGFLVLISTLQKKARWIYGFPLIVILILSFLVAPNTIFRHLYEKKQPTADLMYYKEGKIANVVIYDFYKNGYKDLYLNGIEEASSRLWHVQLFKLLGSLPPLLHQQPDNALMVAFGAGMSAGTTVNLVDHFECAELNPDIFEEAELFKKENGDVVHNPKLNMIFNDGRNHLLLSPKKYSLIISDATNPLTFDSWTLYTREFYQLCKQKLKPGGIFCQWVPIPLPSDAIKVILNSFRDVFPHTSFWIIYGSSQCLMLGTPERLQIDYQELKKKLPGILKSCDFTDYDVNTPEKFLSFFMLGEDELDRYLDGFTKINTDDLPDAQFHGGQNHEGIRTSLEMLKYQDTIMPYLTNLGEDKTRVEDTLKKYLVISRLLSMGYLKDSEFFYRKAQAFASRVKLADDKNIACMLEFGPKRKEYFLDRVKHFPLDANTHNSLGYIYWKEGNFDDAVSEFKRAVSINPDFANAHINLAKTYIDAGRFDQGVKKLLELIELNPTLDVLNMVRQKLLLVHLLRKRKYHSDPQLYVDLGNAYLESGNIMEAIQSFQTALNLKMGDPQILSSLAFLYETIQLVDKAVECYEKLLEAHPDDTNARVKLTELKSIRNDPKANEKWMAEQIKDRTPPSTHPAGCDRAAEKWNKFDFEGKVSAKSLREAAQEFEKVIESDNKHMHAYADAATIYELLKQYGKAADLWEKGLKVAPGNELAMNNINRLKRLEELNYKNPPSYKIPELYNEIGVLYWKNGQIEMAIDYFKKALKEKPDHVMAWANLGANYIEAGKYPEAIHAIEQALKLNPKISYKSQMEGRLEWLKKIVNN